MAANAGEAAVVVNAGEAAAVANPRRRRTDELMVKDQRTQEKLSCEKQIARMALQERDVPAIAKNRKHEAVIHRYKKGERSGVPKEDLLKQDLVERTYNDLGDIRAVILKLLEAKRNGKEVTKELEQACEDHEVVFGIMSDKHDAIAEWGFRPPEVPTIFATGLPELLPA